MIMRTFSESEAIETQFHYLMRTVPKTGAVITNQSSLALRRVIERGCWSEIIPFGTSENWTYQSLDYGARIKLLNNNRLQGTYKPDFFGAHNLDNALAALLAAQHCGVPIEIGLMALEKFQGVRRRLELRGEVKNIKVYDDFAHHPTAIRSTITAVKQRYPGVRVLAVFEPRSNSMKMGHHNDSLPDSLDAADLVYCYTQGLDWNPAILLKSMNNKVSLFDDISTMARAIVNSAVPGDFILIMSNGGFYNIHEKVLDLLGSKVD